MKNRVRQSRVRATHQDFVLDVGSGGYPHSSANILVDRYLDDRCEDRQGRSLRRDRPLVIADIAALPFRNKAFDYVIANQVLEHVESPDRAMDELARVGNRGFVSMPSEVEEFICPVPTHRWVFALRDGIILFKHKQPHHSLPSEQGFGSVFWKLHADPDFKRLRMRRPGLFRVNVEWDQSLPYRQQPDDCRFYNYYDAESIAPLFVVCKPDNVLEYLKRWLTTRLDFDSMYKFARARRNVRRLFQPFRRRRFA